MKRTLGDLEKWAEEREERVLTMMRGDFNARTGTQSCRIGKILDWQEGEKEGRESKDRKMDKEGKILVGFLQEKGWKIFNGRIRKDEEREFTFTSGMEEMVNRLYYWKRRERGLGK